MSESVGVTCTVAADNYVMGVKLINDNGLVQDLTIDYEGGVDWQNKKTVTFQQSNIDERGALVIHAEDSVAGQDHCYQAGLLVHCIASDTRSQWDNFLTNTNNWYSEDGKELCSNNNAAFLSFNVDWISNMTDNGANHIWVENSQVVNLVGTPFSDFPLVSGEILQFKIPKMFVFKTHSIIYFYTNYFLNYFSLHKLD